MNYGVPFRLVAEAAGKFLISAQACKIDAIYCATVGKTGLPTDPEPEGPPVPTLTSVSPTSGPWGTNITIVGSSLGTAPGTVHIGSGDATVVSWADTEIVATVPGGMVGTPYTVTVTLPDAQTATFDSFTYLAAPTVAAVSPSLGMAGASITVMGSGFGAAQGVGTVKFANDVCVVTAWGDSGIVVTAPANTNTPGIPSPVTVTTNDGLVSNADIIFAYTVPSPEVNDFTPVSGPDGTEFTCTGINFGVEGANSRIQIGVENAVIISWSDTEITGTVVQGATELDVLVWPEVHNEAGYYGQWGPGFTYTTAAAVRGTSKKAAKKESKTEVKVEEPKETKSKRDMGKEKERPRAEAKATGTFPTFESGGGFMLIGINDGKIYLGPTELHEGQSYPLDMQCPKGLEVEVSGPCDITFFMLR